MAASHELGLRIRPVAAHGGNFLSGSSAGLPNEVRTKVMKRDNHTCVYCGFRALRFQEVRPADPDAAPRQNRPEDWVTVCHMCDQCLSLERAGFMGEGLLIWMPEMSQPDLNHLVRALYVGRSSDDAVAEAAKRGIDALRSRRDDAKRRLGTDDPLILATVLGDYATAEEGRSHDEKLDGIRFLSLDRRIQRTPTGEVDRFPDMIAYWKSKEGPFGEVPLNQWTSLAERL